MKRTAVLIFGAALMISGCGILGVKKYTEYKKYPIDLNAKVPNVKFAGVRSSHYGIRPFPEAEGWGKAIETMQGYFDGSTPSAIWIVGTMHGKTVCQLEFPPGGKEFPNIAFQDTDKHEPYLQFFDRKGIRVFLQVEPADADMGTLIDLVLSRYKQHPCVAGFGVDVEWYREAHHPQWGEKVKDKTAKAWEARVKSYNPAYRLFLKHWDRRWMPPKYRGDLIFVDDSQVFDNFDHMVTEFADYWANHFKPSTVFFQIGYRGDKKIWSLYQNPPKDLGTAFAQNTSQECGVFWVDFTLRDVLPASENETVK